MKLEAKRNELIEVAKGLQSADLYIKNGIIVNVYSGEFLSENIAVLKDSIAYIGSSQESIGKETKVIDAKGMYVSPGFIEAHSHPWVIYNPVSFTKKVLSQGTTTTVNDNLFFYLHMGPQGLKEMIEDLKQLPGNLLWLIRAISQADYPGEREWFNPKAIQDLLKLEEAVGIAEITRWPLLYNADPFILDTIEFAKKIKKIADGHNAGCNYEKLNSIAASGVSSCHEAITEEEAINRLRLGLWTILRNSSLRPDLGETIKMLTDKHLCTNRVIMSTDGPHPFFVHEEGFIGGLVRKAVELGLPAMQALQMVTINPATYLRLDDYIGGIAPGRQADLLILPDLVSFCPQKVISKGQLVAEEGHLTVKTPEIAWEKYLIRKPFSIKKSLLENLDLYRYPLQSSGEAVSIAYFCSTVITKKKDLYLPSTNGFADLTAHQDLIYAALVDRDGNWVARGIIQNFATGLDGMASTYNTTTELLTLGRNPKAISMAATRVCEMGGGIAIVDNDKVVLEIPLPFTGMMTTSSSFEQAIEYQNQLLAVLQDRGYPFHDILYSLLFLTCDFLPGLRLTPYGLYDVQKGTILNPVASINH